MYAVLVRGNFIKSYSGGGKAAIAPTRAGAWIYRDKAEARRVAQKFGGRVVEITTCAYCTRPGVYWCWNECGGFFFCAEHQTNKHIGRYPCPRCDYEELS